MFTKADFKKGEMAALIQIGEAARRCSGSYIIEAPGNKNWEEVYYSIFILGKYSV